MDLALLSQIGISLSGLVAAVAYILVLGLVVWLLLWVVNYCGIPEPFNKVARVIIVVVAVFILINVLLGLVGHSIVHFM